MSQMLKDAIAAELKRRGMTMYSLAKAMQDAGKISAARKFYDMMRRRSPDCADAAAKYLGLRVVPDQGPKSGTTD